MDVAKDGNSKQMKIVWSAWSASFREPQRVLRPLSVCARSLFFQSTNAGHGGVRANCRRKRSGDAGRHESSGRLVYRKESNTELTHRVMLHIFGWETGIHIIV